MGGALNCVSKCANVNPLHIWQFHKLSSQEIKTFENLDNAHPIFKLSYAPVRDLWEIIIYVETFSPSKCSSRLLCPAINS